MQERHNLSFKKLVITMKCGANVQDQIDISARLLYHLIVEGFHTCSESPHYCTEDCSMTNFEYARKLFSEHRYQLPNLVFWNVNSRNRQQPVRVNAQGVALVSGCNARIFSMLKSGILSPFALMMDVLGSERYAAIVA